MKILSSDGVFWIEAGQVGLTEQFKERVGTVWNLVPKRGLSKSGTYLKPGQIFAHLETNRCLMPLKCPVEGALVSWNTNMLENPDSDEWLIKFQEKNSAV